jgi:hypothetical protein
MPPDDQWTSWSTPRASSGTSIPRSSFIPAFHASGTSFGASVSSMSCRSRSKRRMMWRLYVVSSASMRINPGSARLTAATNSSNPTAPS